MAKRIVLLLLAFAVLLPSQLYAIVPLMNAISQLCVGMLNLLPVAGMLMIMVGAVVYAAGQMMGAETRARANVWATAAITGALMAMLMVAIAPTFLQTLYPDMYTDCSFDCKGPNDAAEIKIDAGSYCCVDDTAGTAAECLKGCTATGTCA